MPGRLQERTEAHDLSPDDPRTPERMAQAALAEHGRIPEMKIILRLTLPASEYRDASPADGSRRAVAAVRAPPG